MLKSYLEENIHTNEHIAEILDTGKEQFILVQAIETWMDSIKERF